MFNCDAVASILNSQWLEPIRYSAKSFFCILVCTEGSQPDVSFAAGAETCTGSANHVGRVQHPVEEFPATHPLGCLYPDVGCIRAAINRESHLGQRLTHQLGVLHVVADGGAYLLLALGCIDSLCGTLADVAGAIELGALATAPQLVQGYG